MSLTIQIREATPADIPCLVEISGASFRTDAHTQLKAAAQSPPMTAEEYMSQGMEGAIPMWLESARVKILVATVPENDKSGQVIAGYIVFSHRHLDRPFNKSMIDERPDPPVQPVQTSGTVEELERITDESMKDWQNWFLSNDMPCYYIISYSVDSA